VIVNAASPPTARRHATVSRRNVPAFSSSFFVQPAGNVETTLSAVASQQTWMSSAANPAGRPTLARFPDAAVATVPAATNVIAT
jgi:hypothetical protein